MGLDRSAHNLIGRKFAVCICNHHVVFTTQTRIVEIIQPPATQSSGCRVTPRRPEWDEDFVYNGKLN